MLAVERRQEIFELLQSFGSVTVSDLALRFSVSEETIRRDLSRMERKGLLQKTYGGAFLNTGMHREIPVTVRQHAAVEGKSVIGSLAAQLINNGDTIFLDASTTAVHIAENILEKTNLVVITNALPVAETLARAEQIKVICAGGTLRPKALSLVGKTAEGSIASFFADKAFICCDGVHLHHGVTDSNEQEAEVRKQMMRQALSSILVCDATKFDRTSFAKLAELEAFDAVITDQERSPEWVDRFIQSEVEYICGSFQEEIPEPTVS
ncbi:transcriptional regulator, DeoR family [Alkalispirochaeta americana]|uniref:Transcriptional regulator, DeoR family n=1 Tax=Alkalispirochaeta americana TaxID=159291 RepID=A0A1N6QE90_9SPIO|nr:DeoR/GlpR family DNA-binding transcription regulator [Alkalispirochaeta americana]SIQ14941.1 transcriptional regulator, DeoR family [Alkalispirochaeta americana]